ncbi:carbohydrate kinase family protein [Salinarimonas soli]|uniref:carbohydrate kinase family protein n=1 Tax=Salinarimonas soli TaxID=1638099 RepID=UPI001661C87F|nr:PfkB family carbohydrate kinase [Salinarimonas soli]
MARVAGVAKGTVSNVLNGRAPVSDAMRERVEAAIQSLGYSPAETARSLTARKRTAFDSRRADPAVPRLTTVGYVSVDYVACLDRLPERDERLMSKEIVKAIGGPAANVAAVAAGLGGGWPVAASLITCIGCDGDSDWALAELASRRVELITPVERREGRLNRALVLVERDGRRTIINEPSSLAEVDLRRFLEATDPAGLTWCLHFEGYQVPPQIAAIPLARARGFKPTMQATGLPPQWLRAHSAQLFLEFDVVVLHRESLIHIEGCPADPGDAAAWLKERAEASERWPEAVIVTLGASGALLVARDGRIARADALPVPVQDTTGAGDAFVGTFLAFWLNHAPLDLALQYACAAGSLAVTRYAAQEIRPSAERLAEAIASQGAASAPRLVPA